MELQSKENTVIPHLERELAETEKAIDNMLNAIEQGIITNSTKQRLESLELKRRDIQNEILKESIKHPILTEELVRFWFERLSKLDIQKLEHRKRLIDSFVNSIFLYDDYLLLTLNFSGETQTVKFSDIDAALSCSDLSVCARPYRVFITKVMNTRYFLP